MSKDLSAASNNRKKRIEWDEDDKETVIDGVFELRMRKPNHPLLTLVNIFQQQLPKHKQRPLTAIGAIPWLEPAIKGRCRELYQRSEKLEKQIQELVNDNKELEDKFQNQPTPEQMLSEVSTGALLSELIQRSTSRLDNIERKVGMLTSCLEELVTSPQHTETRKKVKEVLKRRRPVITILGLIGPQVTGIKKRFGSYADLRFINSDRSPTDLPESDLLILTPKLSHSHNDVVAKQRAKFRKVINCRSVGTKLLHTIEIYLKENHGLRTSD